MYDELIVFTHNDLDALGCMLNIEYKWPTIKKKYFHTNYANIPQIVDDIEEHIKKFGNKHILIPDVSFATDKDSLMRLYNIPGVKITHIDHHLYPDGFWDDFPKMKVVWDKTKSATLLTNEYLGNKGKNSNLDKLSYIIDIYDLWQYKSPHFGIAQDFNNYFWECGIEWLLNEIIDGDYKLPKNYVNVVNDFNERSKNHIEKLESKKLIMRSGGMTVAFTNEFFNQILIKEMNNDQQVVIGVNDYGIVKIRLHQETTLSVNQINKIRLESTGEAETGHLHAFTYKMSSQPSFENIMREIERVAKIFEKVSNEI